MQARWILGCVAWCLVSIARADTGAPAASMPASSSGALPTTTPPAQQASDPALATSTGESIEIDGYRLPLALADTGSLLVVFFGAAAESKGAVTLGTVSFVLAGPVIHATHGHNGRSAASLVIRVGLPLGGWLLGFRHGSKSHYHCDFDNICDRSGEEAGLGMFLGMLGAALIDDIAVAQRVEIHRSAGASWAPQLSAGPHQASVGVAGRF